MFRSYFVDVNTKREVNLKSEDFFIDEMLLMTLTLYSDKGIMVTKS